MADQTLAGFRKQLTDIARENADRMALIEKRSAQNLKDASEKSQKQMTTVSAVVVRLNERNRKVKEAGGWDLKDKDQQSVLAVGELEDEEADQRNEVSWEQPPAPPAPLPAGPAGRHAQQDDDLDEDDYSSNNWLR